MADNEASDGVDIDHLITHLLFRGPTRSSQQQNPSYLNVLAEYYLLCF